MKKLFFGNHEVIIGGRKESAFWKEFSSRAETPRLAAFPNTVTENELQLMEKFIEDSEIPLTHFWFNESGSSLEESLFSRFKLIEAAGGVVRNKKDRVLMMFRKGKWDLPKGKIDKGETIKQAAKREITEETGVRKLKVLRQIRFFNGKQDCTYHSYMLAGRRVIKATYWFEMFTDDTSPLTPQLEENITVAGWFSKKEIREYLKNSYRSVQWVLNECGLK